MKDGNLGNFPVYSATFDKGNSAYAIIGTEYGIFSTTNINAAAPSWGADNSGLARVPVFTLKQYRTDKSSSADVDVMEGDIFAGTFGRGTFQTTTLMNTRPVSIAENEDIEKPSTALRLFPNPAEEKTTIETDLSEGTYQIEVVDLNGRTVLSQKCEARESGMNQFTINISELSNGMYIIGIQGKADSYTRLMVAR